MDEILEKFIFEVNQAFGFLEKYGYKKLKVSSKMLIITLIQYWL